MQHGDLIEYKLGRHEAGDGPSRGVIVAPVTEEHARAWVHAYDRPAYWIAWFDGNQQTWAFERDLTLISKANTK
jgi:hypothetical protein